MALRSAALRLRLTNSTSIPLSRTIPRIRALNSSVLAAQIQQSRNTLQRRFQSTSPATLPKPVPIEPLSSSTHKTIRRSFNLLAIILAFSTGYMLASQPTIQAFVAVATQPSDAKTVHLFKPDPTSQAGVVEAQLQALPLVKQLSANPKWQASRPHLKIPANLKDKSFTGGHLLGENKLPVPPLVFTDGQGKEMISIAFLGTAICGHPGIVHGGLLATLMDEGMARTCFAALPNKVGVTANLTINYRAPCKAGQFVVVRAETTKVEGRKAWVKGRVETLTPDGSPGKVLVEGEALFIEPKGFASQLMRLTS